MSVFFKDVGEDNPVKKGDAEEILKGIGVNIDQSDSDDYHVLLAAVHDVAEHLISLPDYQPIPDRKRYPRENIHLATSSEQAFGHAWAHKFLIRGNKEGRYLKHKTVCLKDCIAVADVPQFFGSDAFPAWTPSTDATVVTRVLDAGADIHGTAVCESFCNSTSSFTSAQGTIENPHREGYSAGGSTSGGAALVAGGIMDIALGTDQGGSIRVPASLCGCVGLKPTHGLVPYTGVTSGDAIDDHAGPIARSVSEIAACLDAIAGNDGIDDRSLGSLPHGSFQFTESLTLESSESLAGLRIGILREGMEQAIVQPAVRELVLKAAKKLEHLGATVEEVSIPMHLEGPAVWTIQQRISGAAGVLGQSHGRRGLCLTEFEQARLPWTAENFAKLFPSTKNTVINGIYLAKNFPGLYGKAVNIGRQIRDAYEEKLGQYDVLIMPTTPYVAPKHGVRDTPRTCFEPSIGLTTNTAIFNVTGHPAMTIPVGFAPAKEDPAVMLPVGMQIVGGLWRERTILRIGHAWESSFNWKETRFSDTAVSQQDLHASCDGINVNGKRPLEMEIPAGKMSPILYACNLCAWVVADSEGIVSWLNQFRGLVSNLAGDTYLTGVGLYDDVERGSYIAPLKAGARWDDPGYERPESDEFGTGRRAENGRYGFIFHESCWSILERAANPTGIPYARLYEICLSLPRPLESSCVSWGHNYGGLVAIDDQHYFPWEEREAQFDFNGSSVSNSEEDDDDDDGGGFGGLGVPAADRLPLPDDEDEDSEMTKPTIMIAVPKGDPFRIPEIQFLLSEKPEPPPDIQLQATALSAGDCFHRLPKEIRTRIALLLSTADALSTRLASKSFWYIFDSHQFWLSRFKGNSERSWLFEAKQIDNFRDWRWLYRRTNSANLAPSPMIQNRRRVWDLAQNVTDIWLQLKVNAALLQSSPISDSDLSPWTEASGDIKSVRPDAPYVEFFEGCRTLYRQKQNLSRLGSLSRIAFSFIQVGNTRFLTGIRFVPRVGDSVQVGYQAELEQILDISTLHGFVLALGSRGIHAVQCITNHHEHPWCGNPSNSLRSRRLAIGDPIAALDAGLDGFKIVSLSIASDISHSHGVALKAPKTLRDSGIWYPDLPSSQLCLNEDFYIQREYHVSGFRPLIWTLFGGPGGIYLPNLTGIAVHMGGSIPGIDFRYAPGCRIPWEFSIDGPGGERISGVEVYLTFIDRENSYEIYDQGALESFKFGNGLNYGMASLGVISEASS
ncbi:hypothetical protein JX265_002411 [Neoarthrinium moseri]|uniref:Amidase n=1 Tax=Neoarthrinium moseri TaxID=1658444 RepID=A0A9P9WUE7_9PEZI|nr:hypothetical protein JX265_002411 [Neoarthrinium moseri]